MEVKLPHPVLCYVDGSFAYFSNNPNQTGDDWDDAPYEHNAGEPYEREGFTIIKVAFDGAFDPPCYGVSNSSYSVDLINSGAIAWLTSRWSNAAVSIPAGVTISKFSKRITEGNGYVYFNPKDIPKSESDILKTEMHKKHVFQLIHSASLILESVLKMEESKP